MHQKNIYYYAHQGLKCAVRHYILVDKQIKTDLAFRRYATKQSKLRTYGTLPNFKLKFYRYVVPNGTINGISTLDSHYL